MDGVHDMGGMDGFGKVEPEPNEPVFHAAWEGRVMAMNRAMGATGAWNIDMSRFSREELPPHVYLGSSYYRKWFLGLEQMLIDRGLIDADEVAARYKPGDRVRAKNIHPATHTRLPRYVRGHVGVVERLHGSQVFPDTAAVGQGDNPQWLYTVRFDSRELWGPDADPTVKVSVDAFEPYLDPA